jgi:hypothetical protein
MPAIIEQIQRDAVATDVPVSALLRRVKLAAVKLGQANPRRCRAPDRRMERTAGRAHAHAVLADDRRRHHGTTLVSMGALPCLPDHNGYRFAQDRSSSRRGDYEPHSGAVLPTMSTARAVRRTVATVADQHCG